MKTTFSWATLFLFSVSFPLLLLPSSLRVLRNLIWGGSSGIIIIFQLQAKVYTYSINSKMVWKLLELLKSLNSISIKSFKLKLKQKSKFSCWYASGESKLLKSLIGNLNRPACCWLECGSEQPIMGWKTPAGSQINEWIITVHKAA